MKGPLARVLERADISTKDGVVTGIPVVRVVEQEDLLFIRDYNVTKPLTEEAFRQMMQPEIAESEKITKEEYDKLAAQIQGPDGDIHTFNKAKKLKAFLYIDETGAQVLLIPKTVVKQDK